MSSSRIDDFAAVDQAEVRSLILRGLADHWGEIDETLNPDLDDILASYGHGRTIVVRDGDEIIGTGTIVPLQDDRAEIVRMSVAANARRCGLGERIVEALLATAREWAVRAVILETTSTWTDVEAFYLSCGFRITHTTEGDFGTDTWFEREIELCTSRGRP